MKKITIFLLLLLLSAAAMAQFPKPTTTTTPKRMTGSYWFMANIDTTTGGYADTLGLYVLADTAYLWNNKGHVKIDTIIFADGTKIFSNDSSTLTIIKLQTDTIIGSNPLADSCVEYLKVKHIASCSPLWLSSPDSVWVTGELRQIDGSVAFRGTSGINPFSNGGTLFMWYPPKSALRAGYGVSDDWATDSIGNYSFALGYRVRAIGANSFTIGSYNRAANDSSFAIGNSNKVTANENAFAVGSQNNIRSDYGISVGNTNSINASSSQSYIFGRSNISNAPISLLVGDNNTSAAGQSQVGIGLQNVITSGENVLSVGFINNIDDSLNFAFGANNSTQTAAKRNVLIGNSNGITGGQRNIAIGNVNTITESNCIAIGDTNIISVVGGTGVSINKISIGVANSQLSENVSFIVGTYNGDSATYSTGILGHSSFIGDEVQYSYVIGNNNFIEKNSLNSGLFGNNLRLKTTINSYLIGSNLYTNKSNQTAVGSYNDSTVNARFVVGIGATAGAEANGLEVYSDSTVRTPGKFAQYKPDHAFVTYSDNTGYPVQIAVQSAWMDITDSTAVRLTSVEVGDGFTNDNDTIVYSGYDDAHLKFTVSISMSGTNGNDLLIRVYNVTDGSPVHTMKHVTMTGATNRASVTLLGYDVNANVGDRYIVQVANTSASANITIYDIGWLCEVTHYK